MSKLPFKKRLVITSVQEPDNEASISSQKSSVKSLGSFRLRFKSGGTNRTKQGRDTATATPDSNLQADVPMDTIDQNIQESSQLEISIVDIPKARQTGQQFEDTVADPDPEVSIVDIFRAQPAEIRKYGCQERPTKEVIDGLMSEQQHISLNNTSDEGNVHQSDGTQLSNNKLDLPQTETIHQSYQQEKEPAQAGTEQSKDDQQLSAEEGTQEIDLLQKGGELICTEKLQQMHTGQDIESDPGNEDYQLPEIEPLFVRKAENEIEIEILIGTDAPLDTEKEYSDYHEIQSLPEMEPVAVDLCEVHEEGRHLNNSIQHTSPHSDELREYTSEDVEDSFHFLSPEEEPVLSPDFQERAIRSVSAVVIHDSQPSSLSYSMLKCRDNFNGCCTYDFCNSRNSQALKVSPEAHAASKQGITMMKKLIYPGMPKVFQDLWVLSELAITITQLVLAVISLTLNQNVFNIVYVSITAFGIILALMDSFLHFITLGACASIIKHFRKKRKSKLNADKKLPENEQNGCGCSFFSTKTRQQILEVLDFIRNWITDIVLYPLVILDMYDLITSQLYLLQTSDHRVNFSLFIISVAFLLLSVYLTRFVMIITAALNLRRVPSDSSGSHKKIVSMSLWFLVHVFAQIIIHALIFVSIGMNIYLENTEFQLVGTNSTTSRPIFDYSSISIRSSILNSSFYLIYSAVTGLLVTQLGLVSFFIVNYYQIRELSIAFWVDMISMLQSENFAGLVFDGGIKSAKKKTREIAQNKKYKKVKENLVTIEAAPLYVKLFYPFRIPVFVVLGILYGILLGTFLAFLSVTCSPLPGSSELFCVSFFTNPSVYSIPYFFTCVVIILANIQVIFMVVVWLLVVSLVLFSIILAPVVLVIFIILYVLLGSIGVCVLLLSDLFS